MSGMTPQNLLPSYKIQPCCSNCKKAILDLSMGGGGRGWCNRDRDRPAIDYENEESGDDTAQFEWGKTHEIAMEGWCKAWQSRK